MGTAPPPSAAGPSSSAPAAQRRGDHSSRSSAAAGGDSAYTGTLFFNLLTHVNRSESRVEALVRLALRHLAQAGETWEAVRRAFIVVASPQSLADLDGDRNRALWCVVDGLLKHAPAVFAPVIGQRLLELVTQQTPLQLMSAAATAASTAASLLGDGPAAGEERRDESWGWWEGLVRSWAPFLSPETYAPVYDYVVQRKSAAELHGALAQSGGAAATDAASLQRPATEAELQSLTDEWRAMRYAAESRRAGTTAAVAAAASPGGFSFEELLASFVAEAATTTGDGEGGGKPAAPQPPKDGKAAPAVAAAPTPQAAPPAPKGSDTESSDDDDDDDDQYVPEFIAGAQPRQLPDRGLPAQRRRRRRPREDDY